MAGGRPYKRGLDFFPLDVDIDNDPKTRYMHSKFGDSGFAFMVKLFCRIYSDGYFLFLTEEFITDFCEVSIKKSLDEFHRMLDYSFKINLFDKTIFDKYNILTSPSIQSRYLSVTKRREEVKIIKEYKINDIKLPAGTILITLADDTKEVVQATKKKRSKAQLKKDQIPLRFNPPEEERKHTTVATTSHPLPTPLQVVQKQPLIWTFEQASEWARKPYDDHNDLFKKQNTKAWYESYQRYVKNIDENYPYIQVSNFQLRLPEYINLINEEKPSEDELNKALVMLNKTGMDIRNPVYYKVKDYIGKVRADAAKGVVETKTPVRNVLHDARKTNGS